MAAENQNKKLDRLTNKYVLQSNEQFPKKVSVFRKHAIHMLTIFESIIDVAPQPEDVPKDYASWTPEKINKEIFNAFPDLRTNKARIPNRMTSLNKVMK